MRFDLPSILRLVGQSVRDPAGVAEVIIGWQLPRAVLWQSLVLVTVLSVLLVSLLTGLSAPIAPPEDVIEGAPVMTGLAPLTYGLLLGTSLVLLVFSLYYTGLALGGTATFDAALALIVWLEVVAMAVRVLQSVLLLLSPPIAGLFSLAALILLLWMLVNFIKVMHRFESLGKSTLVLLLALFGLGFVLTIALSLFGIQIPGAVA